MFGGRLKGKIFAWGVHMLTASGIVFGFFAVVAISRKEFVEAYYFLAAAFFVDGIDGTLARKLKVASVLPFMDGSLMDDVIDFSNDVVIPCFFIYSCGRYIDDSFQLFFSEGLREVVVIAVLMVSTLYYGKRNMISEEMYFNGFPSLWNFVFFYLFFIFDFSELVNLAVVLLVALAHFPFFKFPYVSRAIRHKFFKVVAACVLAISNVTLLYLWGQGKDSEILVILSISSAAYFVCDALVVSLRFQLKKNST